MKEPVEGRQMCLVDRVQAWHAQSPGLDQQQTELGRVEQANTTSPWEVEAEQSRQSSTARLS